LCVILNYVHKIPYHGIFIKIIRTEVAFFMKGKRSPSFTQSKWFRLASSLGLALGLALTLLLLPVVAGTVVQLSSPTLPQAESIAEQLPTGESNWSVDQVVEVVLPFKADEALADSVRVDIGGGNYITITKEAYIDIPHNLAGASTVVTTVRQAFGPNDTFNDPAVVTDTAIRYRFRIDTDVTINGEMKLRDVVPSGTSCIETNNLDFNDWTHSSADCVNFGVAEFTLPSGLQLTAGQPVTLEYRVRPYTYNGATLENDEVTLTGDNLSSDFTFSGLNVTTTVKAPQWAITKTADLTRVTSSETITYNVSLYNMGDQQLYGGIWSAPRDPDGNTLGTYPVTVTDIISKDYVVAGSIKTYDTGIATSSIDSNDDVYTITWVVTQTNFVIPAGGSLADYLTVTLQITSGTLPGGTAIPNWVHVEGGSNTVGEATNVLSVPYYIPGSVLTVNKTIYPDPVVAGERFTYTVSFTANQDVTNIAIVDNISEVLSYATFDSVNTSDSNATATWDNATSIDIAYNGTLTADTQVDVYLWFTADSPLAEGTVITNNIAKSDISPVVEIITSTNPGFYGGVISVPVEITVTNDIEIVKIANPNVVEPGGTVRYRIVMTNHGTNGLSYVSITDVLTDYITFTNVAYFGPPAYRGTVSDQQWVLHSFPITNGTPLNRRFWELDAVVLDRPSSGAPIANFGPYTNSLYAENSLGAVVTNVGVTAGSLPGAEVYIADAAISVTKLITTGIADTAWTQGSLRNNLDASYNLRTGQIITYVYIITNNGSISLTANITDDKAGTIGLGTTLTASETISRVITYTIHASDLTSGAFLTNVVTVAATLWDTSLGSFPGITETATASIELTSSKAIFVGKSVMSNTWATAGRSKATVGDILTYTFYVTNNYLEYVGFAGTSAFADDKLDLSGTTIQQAIADVLPNGAAIHNLDSTLIPVGSVLNNPSIPVITPFETISVILTTTLDANILNTAFTEDGLTAANTTGRTTSVLTNAFTVNSTIAPDGSTTFDVLPSNPVTASIPITYVASLSYYKKIANVVTPTRAFTYGDNVQFNIVIHNTGGVPLVIEAGNITDVLSTTVASRGEFSSTSNITIQPGAWYTFNTQMANNVGTAISDFTIGAEEVVSSNYASYYLTGIGAQMITGVMTNTVYAPTVISDATTTTSYPLLAAILDDSGNFANGYVVDSKMSVISGYSNSVAFTLTDVVSPSITKWVTVPSGDVSNVSLGDAITYYYRIDNNGTVPMSISVTDIITEINGRKTYTISDNGNLAIAPIAPGASYTITWERTVDASFAAQVGPDDPAGEFRTLSNTAIVTGWVVHPDTNLRVGTAVATSTQVTVTIVSTSLMDIEKLAFVSKDSGTTWAPLVEGADVNIGDVLSWVYTITNQTDNVITGIKVSDYDGGARFNTSGLVFTSATVVGTQGFTLYGSSSSMTNTRTFQSAPYTVDEDRLAYALGNNGATTNRPAPFNTHTYGWVCGSYICAENLVRATGTVSNSGVVDGIFGSQSFDIRYVYTTSLVITKQASVTIGNVGQAITYNIILENAGDTAIQHFKITDESPIHPYPSGMLPEISVNEAFLINAALDPGEVYTYTAYYTPTANDQALTRAFFGGVLTNTATAVATPSLYVRLVALTVSPVTATLVVSQPVVTAQASIMLTSPGSIALDKSAMWNSYPNPAGFNEYVTYTYRITNDGNIEFTAANNPNSFGFPIETFSSLVDVTPATLNPVKTTQPLVSKSLYQTGDLINYTIVVTNTDGVERDVVVVDVIDQLLDLQLVTPDKGTNNSDLGQGIVSVAATLAPDEAITINFATVVNNQAVGGGVVLYDSNRNINTVISLAELPGGTLSPGEVITVQRAIQLIPQYFEAGLYLTNTAKVTGWVNPGLVLGGQVTNPGFETATVPLTYSVDIDVNKSIAEYPNAPNTLVNVGQSVTFTFEVANNGNAPVEVVLTDTYQNGEIAWVSSPIPLDGGETRTVTQAIQIEPRFLDVGEPGESEFITNTVLAVASDSYGNIGAGDYTATDTASLEAVLNFKLIITKTTASDADGNNTHDTPVEIGDVVDYHFVISNAGTSEVTFDLVDIVDTAAGVPPMTVTPAYTLTAGELITLTLPVTISDELLGNVTRYMQDYGLARVFSVDGNPVPATPFQSNYYTTTITYTVEVVVIKSTEPLVTEAQIGDTITYTYRVINEGDVGVNPVRVTDDKLGTIENAAGILAPSGQVFFVLTTTIQPGDVDVNGRIVNQATAVATRTGVTGVSAPDFYTITISLGEQIVITKTANVTQANIGDTVIYSYWVKNTGEVAVSNVTVDDPLLGINSTEIAATLNPDENTNVFTASYVIPSSSADPLINTIMARALVLGNPLDVVSATDIATIDILDDPPPTTALAFTKIADPVAGSTVQTGDTIVYHLIVTNVTTSTVVMTNVDVVDTLAQGLQFVSSNPDPTSVNGDERVFRFATLTTSETVMITATVVATTGTTLNEGFGRASDGSVTSVVQVEHNIQPTVDHLLQISKISEQPDATLYIGDMITYTIRVTNAGTSVENGVVIRDAITDVLDIVSIDPSAGTVMTVGNTVVVTVGTLNPDATAQVVIVTRINENARGLMTIPNVASVASDDFVQSTEPDGEDVVQSDQPITTQPMIIYLPIILTQPTVATSTPTATPTGTTTGETPTATPTPTTAGPNLQSRIEIESFDENTGEAIIKVFVKNVGDAPATPRDGSSQVYVELYINPNIGTDDELRTQGGRWDSYRPADNTTMTRGVAWLLDLSASPIAPDQEIELTTTGGYSEQQSDWDGKLTTGMTTKLYSFVDSFYQADPNPPFVVNETNEGDNMGGPVQRTTAGQAPASIPAPTMPERTH